MRIQLELTRENNTREFIVNSYCDLGAILSQIQWKKDTRKGLSRSRRYDATAFDYKIYLQNPETTSGIISFT